MDTRWSDGFFTGNKKLRDVVNNTGWNCSYVKLTLFMEPNSVMIVAR